MTQTALSQLPSFDELAKQSNLTNSQLLIWLGQQLNPDAPLYNMAMRFDVHGALDIKVFKSALDYVVAESDVMRSVINVNDGIPQQRVLKILDGYLEIIDLSDGADPETLCAREIKPRIRESFDLSKANFTSTLFKLAPSHFVWFFNQHHLFTDLKSIELIYKQVSKQYLQLATALEDSVHLVELSMPQYANYLELHSSRVPTGESPNSPGTREAVPLYHRDTRHRQTASHRTEHVMTASSMEQLKSLTARPEFAALSLELSLFNIFATAFCAYLHRVSDAETLSIGAPVHNRATLDFKNTIGLFIELHPILVVVNSEDTFVSLHEKVSESSYEHLKLAASHKGGITAARGFNVVLNYIKAGFDAFGEFPCEAEWLHNNHIDPQHSLRFQVVDLTGKGRIKLCFDFNAELLTKAQGADALAHFVHVLEGLISNPDQEISKVSLVGLTEHPNLVSRFSTIHRSRRNGVADPSPGTVLSRFAHQVKTSPQSVAAIDGARQISYFELNRLSNALAQQILTQHGCVEKIAVCAARSFELLVAILAAQKSGAAFVPLDPAHPDARLRQIVESGEIRLVLSDTAQEERLQAICPSVIKVALLEESGLRDSLVALPEIKPDNDAYVIFTSGSTGAPKGVVVRHCELADYVEWAGRMYCAEVDASQELGVNPSRDVFPLYSSIGFDLTITSIFVPLTQGGAIRVYSEEKTSLDLSVIKVMQENAVDVIKLTPAHLALLSGLDAKNTRTHTLILGGENLTTSVARQASRLFRKDVRIFNEYGPTEAVVGCMIHQYQPENDADISVPIGMPADGVNIYLLDPGGNPVPCGVTGELWIGGRRLAMGYLNRPDLTDERFLPDPFLGVGRMYKTGDLARISERGQMLYVGRQDAQLKIRGVRIETAEISNVLQAHPSINDCHVMALQPRPHSNSQPTHYCSVCGLASNYPGVSFDQNGKCNHCHDFDSYRDLAAGYFRSMPELKTLLQKLSSAKRGSYDVMMLLSGGKDSTYALYQVCALGFKVFAMTLDNGYISEGAKANIARSVTDLGIDHEFVTSDAMSAIFADSLNRHSSVCYGCFKTIYTLAINHAHKKGIPAIITGLSRGQMFETRLTKQVLEKTRSDPALIDREVLETRKIYHRIPDKVTESINMSLFASDNIFDEIQFVDFYRYCDVSMDEMYEFLRQNAPWTRPADTGRSTNCLINDTGIFVHKRKLGYHNYALPYSWDVRLGHKRRDAAVEELNDRIDVGRVHEILQEIDFDGTELLEGVDQKKLAAFYTGSQPVAADDMRTYLRERLPESMIPSFFVHLHDLPLTTNGKVDQNALPDPRMERPALAQQIIPPNTETEKVLVEIWRDVLRINQVGIYDNFLDLGGDSITAIQIVVRAGESGLLITPNQLFLHPTVHSLAEASASDIPGQTIRKNEDHRPFSLLDEEDMSGGLSSLLDS